MEFACVFCDKECTRVCGGQTVRSVLVSVVAKSVLLLVVAKSALVFMMAKSKFVSVVAKKYCFFLCFWWQRVHMYEW